MEFNIDICNTIQGGITILDLSKEYNQYLPENSIDSSVYEDTLLFKYSDTVTVNSLLYVTTKNIKYVDALIHEHIKLDNGIFKDDSCTFNILEDGYYTIDHFIFPNINWYNWYKTKASEEYKQKVNRIYIIDKGVIKKGKTFGDLYAKADAALYRAKQNGKNTFVIFDSTRTTQNRTFLIRWLCPLRAQAQLRAFGRSF